MARCGHPHNTPACLSGCGGRAGHTGVSEGTGGLSQGPGGYSQRSPQPQTPSRCKKESLRRRAGGEAPGGEEEARVGLTGRLRVVGSCWITHWGWDRVWVIAQKTTGSGNNVISIQSVYTRTLRTLAWRGQASIHLETLLPHYLGWHPGLTPHKPAGWASSLRAWASVSLSIERGQYKSLLQ